MELERDFTLRNKTGLHLRAAGKLAEAAGQFECDIGIGNGGRVVDGKSIVDLLTLGAVPGSVITIRTSGCDAQAAIEALEKLIADNFDE